MFLGQPLRSALDELAYLIGTLESEMRGRPSIAVLVVSDDDPDSVEMNCVEGVFVGEVVADVDRQQVTGRVDAIANPGQCRPLIPVDVWPQLDEHASAG